MVTLTTTDAPAAYPWGSGSPIIGSEGQDYITWDGFTINQHDINYRFGNGIVQIRSGADYVTIKNCAITGEYLPDVEGDQHNGILAMGAEYSVDMKGLVIQGNIIGGFTGANDNSTGITIYFIEDALIEHNELWGSGSGLPGKTAPIDSVNVPG